MKIINIKNKQTSYKYSVTDISIKKEDSPRVIRDSLAKIFRSCRAGEIRIFLSSLNKSGDQLIEEKCHAIPITVGHLSSTHYVYMDRFNMMYDQLMCHCNECHRDAVMILNFAPKKQNKALTQRVYLTVSNGRG